jgi:predicted metalloprotease with PDZ domain
MKSAYLKPAVALVWVFVLSSAAAQTNDPTSNGPSPFPMPAPIPAPQDKPYPGTIKLSVDATDTARAIFRVHETIPVAQSGLVTLLYPKWLPGNHGPSGPIDKLAGLEIRADGSRLAWKRDTVDVYAFHVAVPKDATTLDVDFQYVSPVANNEGRIVMTPELMDVQWNALALYPAGFYSRQIMVKPSIKLPSGWQYGTALEQSSADNGTVTFKSVPFNTLVDSPMFAGRYFARVDLDPGAKVPVHMDIVADRPDELVISPAQLQAHRNLVQQAYKLFGSRHYDHYDFLLGLSDVMSGIGLEHHRSSEDGTAGKYFKDWDAGAASRDLLSHEYTHSWNGKFRRPADLWTPNFNVPMRDSLLWVYEGQTEFWGVVLAPRAGLWTEQQGLDAIALDAAVYDARIGREWRPLQDTTNDPVLSMRRPQPWRSWQRSEDYYVEGALIWLDADTLIRQKTGGKKSMDDFARAFFGVNDGSYVTLTYTFDDIVRTLNSVMPYDWANFLITRLDGNGPAPLDGISRGGYKLVYTDKASDFQKSSEKMRKTTDFLFSLGVIIDKSGALTEVMWDGPAFNAGATVGATIVAINGVAYDSDLLKDTITDAKTTGAPIQLLLKRGDRYQTISINYRGGLRYPHLERVAGTPALLDALLAPRN